MKPLRNRSRDVWKVESTMLVAIPRGRLRDKLEELSHSLPCRIHLLDQHNGESETNPSAPDFYAAIIDRRYLGAKAWSSIEGKYASTEEHGAFILVDDLPSSSLCVQHFQKCNETNLEEQRQVLEVVTMLYQFENLNTVFHSD